MCPPPPTVHQMYYGSREGLFQFYFNFLHTLYPTDIPHPYICNKPYHTMPRTKTKKTEKKRPRFGEYTTAKRVVVDLDAPAKERWVEAARAYRVPLRVFAKELRAAAKELGVKRLRTIVSLWEDALARCGMEEMVEELQGLAAFLKIPASHLVLGNMQYELAVAGCTSILLRTPSGRPILARTLDWDATLAPLVTEVVFTRGTKVVAVSPSIIGLLGCTTGAAAARPAGTRFSVALNHRPEEEDTSLALAEEDVLVAAIERRWAQVLELLTSCWPIAVLIRKVLTIEEASYTKAVEMLKDATLIASAYVLVIGGREGRCITKERAEPGGAEELLGSDPWSVVVQCNHDNEHVGVARMRDDCSMRRREVARRFFSGLPGEYGRVLASLGKVVGAKERASQRRGVLHCLVKRYFKCPPLFCQERTAFYSVSDPSSNRHVMRARV